MISRSSCLYGESWLKLGIIANTLKRVNLSFSSRDREIFITIRPVLWVSLMRWRKLSRRKLCSGWQLEEMTVTFISMNYYTDACVENTVTSRWTLKIRSMNSPPSTESSWKFRLSRTTIRILTINISIKELSLKPTVSIHSWPKWTTRLPLRLGWNTLGNHWKLKSTVGSRRTPQHRKWDVL